MDMTLNSSNNSGSGDHRGAPLSSKRNRSEPRNLRIVMSGRHTFKLSDVDDTDESSSLVESRVCNQSYPLPPERFSDSSERLSCFNKALSKFKFTELALASRNFMLDDQTLPMDSIDSSGATFFPLESTGCVKEFSGPSECISAHLPSSDTRLLNRSRLQQEKQCPRIVKSDNSLHNRSSAAPRPSSSSSAQSRQQSPTWSLLHSSSDDLMLYDKSFKNAMIQDVLQLKKQLLCLRRILLEEKAFDFKQTESLNPFDHVSMNLLSACGLDSKLLNNIDLASINSSTTEDPLQELMDQRRQVVYLQGQIEDRDRTIRLQRNLIEQLEAEKRQAGSNVKDRISMATQTESTLPLAIAAENLSRSKPAFTSYTTHFPTLPCNDSKVAATTKIRHPQKYPCNVHDSRSSNNHWQAVKPTRRHTIISTTLTNYNQQLAAAFFPGKANTGTAGASTSTNPAYKPVRITLIGEPLQDGCQKLQQNGV